MDGEKKRGLVIGLTGPTGAGKGAVGRLLEQRGCRVIDCDRLARVIVEPGRPALAELAEAFGADILRADGTLDRALLAQRGFATPESNALLCSLTHPRVAELVREESAEILAQGLHAVVDAPLLFESKLDAECDCRVAVLAPAEVRLRRIIERDGITEEAARRRMSAQQPDGFYASRAEYVIVNDGTVEKLARTAAPVLDRLFADCAAHERTHEMRLAPEPFAMMKSGEKTIELRLFDEKRRGIREGDAIVFTETVTGERLRAAVTGLHRFGSFAELYGALPLTKCGYTEENAAQASPSDMELYYSAEEQKKYGVVGIELSGVEPLGGGSKSGSEAKGGAR